MLPPSTPFLYLLISTFKIHLFFSPMFISVSISPSDFLRHHYSTCRYVRTPPPPSRLVFFFFSCVLHTMDPSGGLHSPLNNKLLADRQIVPHTIATH